MKDVTKRSIYRWIHVIFSIPIIGYILQSLRQTSRLRSANPVHLRSWDDSFGIVDVERPRRSPADLEKTNC